MGQGRNHKLCDIYQESRVVIFMNNNEFIAVVAPIAVKLRMEGSSIFPSVRIAQAMHETGVVIHPWFNLVGFKATSHTSPFWDGRTVGTSTTEEYNGIDQQEFANWRVYSSIEDCFRDQDLLFEWDNYDNVRNAKTPEQQCREFIKSPEKYATDSQYPQGLLKWLNGCNLKQYDQEAVRNLQKIDDMEARLQVVEKKLKKTSPPPWFIDEFGAHALDSIVNDLTGDEEFWRDVAVNLRLKNK